jgi:hypothetical protein
MADQSSLEIEIQDVVRLCFLDRTRVGMPSHGWVAGRGMRVAGPGGAGRQASLLHVVKPACGDPNDCRWPWCLNS